MNIFEYLDYRKLLKDLYEQRKARNSAFSYRYMGAKVGFKSAGFFSNIIQGKRNISTRMTYSFAEVFKFNKRETEYFELIVLHDQAKVHDQKKRYYEKALALRKSKVPSMHAHQYHYFERWYNVAIRELLNFYDFDGDFKKLGKILQPSITVKEAEKAVGLLLKLELIAVDSAGKYRVTDKTITTEPHVPLHAVHSFQIAMMKLAMESIDRYKRSQRTISSLTVSVSDETFAVIEERLATFRREMMDLVKRDEHKINNVYQFNFQIFPLANTELLDDTE